MPQTTKLIAASACPSGGNAQFGSKPRKANRLLGFEQTTSAAGNTASTSVTYQYNSAGDLLGDGLTSYLYDSEGRMQSA